VTKLKDFQSLFVHELKDLYSAEKQLSKIMPKLTKAVSNEDLRSMLQEHRTRTEQQIHRLDEIFQNMGVNTRGAKCPAMEGLVEEAKLLLEGESTPEVLDAAIICAQQRIEHYEIAGYGCARTFANYLGDEQAAKLLQDSLNEESAANEKLNQIAFQQVNTEAMASAGQGAR
jgi:ferritin-like metal-binding protein YciE